MNYIDNSCVLSNSGQ